MQSKFKKKIRNIEKDNLLRNKERETDEINRYNNN